MGRVLVVLVPVFMVLLPAFAGAAVPSCPTGQVSQYTVTSPLSSWNQCAPGTVTSDLAQCLKDYWSPATCTSAQHYTIHYYPTGPVVLTGTSTTAQAARQYSRIQVTYDSACTTVTSPGTEYTDSVRAVQGTYTCIDGGSTCSSRSGQGNPFTISGPISTINTASQQTQCDLVTGCLVRETLPIGRVQTAGGSLTSWSAYGQYTGGTCAGTEPTVVEQSPKPLPDSTQGACVTNSAGVNSCVSETKSNCGYVNGEYRCITSAQLTDANPCVQTASGGVFCKADAPAQPLAPTNADGTIKPADSTFALTSPGGTSTTQVNYYSASTVQGGSQNPGSDAGGDSAGKGDCGSKDTPCHVVVDTGGTATGTGTGGGDGDGYGDGDGQCTGANCGTAAPGFGGVNDFGTSLSNFVGDIQSSPLAQAMVHVGDSVPAGGSAPSSCFQAFGQQFCYAVPDEVVSVIAPVLALVMKAVWCLVAIIVFMKA